ncbi:hypothetical protein [Microbacterium aerolatum]|uniref:hypothetical protein n=1 Tax=Microbacterium aerolatum TaxID=153731 RepID=UPI003851198E
MNPTVSKRAKALLSETSLITKIITGIGLSLILMLGAWSGENHESETSILTISVDIASTPTQDTYSAEVPIPGAAVDDGVILGVAGCLLGIACCFLMFVIARALSVRVPLRALVCLPRMRAPSLATGRPFTAPLSLTQLSLSRT